MKSLTLLAALAAALAIAACGGSDDGDQESSTTASETTASSGSCAEIEDLDVPPYEHDNREFTVDDYLTIPPAGGDHTDAALPAGGAYAAGEAPLGAAVHLLEHGAVIAWTNELDPEDKSAIEAEIEAASEEGYYQLAIVELPELEGPFALSAWGAVQNCTEADPSAIRPFIEEWYASAKSVESALACQGEARRLPPC